MFVFIFGIIDNDIIPLIWKMTSWRLIVLFWYFWFDSYLFRVTSNLPSYNSGNSRLNPLIKCQNDFSKFDQWTSLQHYFDSAIRPRIFTWFFTFRHVLLNSFNILNKIGDNASTFICQKFVSKFLSWCFAALPQFTQKYLNYGNKMFVLPKNVVRPFRCR